MASDVAEQARHDGVDARRGSARQAVRDRSFEEQPMIILAVAL
jgi:hypothetical protein